MAFNQSAVGKSFGPYEFAYDWKRTALYALACGSDLDELDLLLETNGPKVLPTFSVVVVREPLIEAINALGGNYLTLVHGAQRCVAHRAVPPEAKLKTTVTIKGLYDKQKAALAIYESKTIDEKNEPVFDTEWQIFYRGEGGFGGDRGPESPSYNPPEGKAADVRFEMKTQPTQAMLYRIASGDLNPIHANPQVAQIAGFDRPILHGLCTFGHASRAAVNGLCDKDPTRLLSFEGRFSKPVFPGETIITEIWKMKPGEAYYTSKLKERDETVITLGRILYR
jgi:acyl dehydratase